MRMAEPGSDTVECGVIVIGRNEGERLQRCLDSLLAPTRLVVYVDSGSTDGSRELARDKGVDVVALDPAEPFTAARARNAGWRRACEIAPQLKFIQFVDGDCEVATEWMEVGRKFLESYADVAVVCGRRRERFPRRSVYNLLCDIEWDTPVGEARACGGDAMMRVEALNAAGGYREDLIAGEEPELCVRLRVIGWRIWRIGEEMTRHDADMVRFGQWWRRSLRAGYAFAEGAFLHGRTLERHRVRQSRSAWLWGGWLPLGTGCAFALWGAWGLLPLAAYPVQIARVALVGRRSALENLVWAIFLVLGKFPEAVGQAKFWYCRSVGERTSLIEYK